MKNPSLIQVEFFLVDLSGGLGALGRVLADCAERMADGRHIKLVVRFHDDAYGSLERSAKHCEKLQAEFDALVEQEPVNTGWWHWLFHASPQRVCSKKLRAKAHHLNLVRRRLSEVASGGETIAIEQSDHRFRIAKRSEIECILATADKAESAWTFVFAPNLLLSNSNEIITNIM